MRNYCHFRVSFVSFVASIRRQVSILTVLLSLAAFGGLLLVSDWSADPVFANTVGFWNFNDGTPKNALTNQTLTMRAGSISGGTLNSGWASGSVANLPTGNSPYTLSVMMKTTTVGNMGMVGWGQYTVTDRCIAIRTLDGQSTPANGNAFRHYWWVTDMDSYEQPTWGTSAISGRWNHVAATGDSSNLYTYMNGQLLTTMHHEGHNASNEQFTVGATYNGNEPFYGTLDNIGVYNSTMSHADVINVSSSRYNDLAAEWNAQDFTSGQNWVDRVGGRQAAIGNSPARSGNSVVFEAGEHDFFTVSAADNPTVGLKTFTVLVAFTPDGAGEDNPNWYSSTGIISGEQGGLMNDWGLGYDAQRRLVGGAGASDIDHTLKSNCTIGQGVSTVAGYVLDDGSMKLYNNGVLDSSLSGFPGGERVNRPFYIGRIGEADNCYYDGSISSIRIFTRELNSSEMKYYSGQMANSHTYVAMTEANAGSVNPATTSTLWAQTGTMDISGRSINTPLGLYVGGFATTGTLTASFNQFSGAQMTLVLGGGTLNVTTNDGSYTKTLNIDGGTLNSTGNLNLNGDSRLMLKEGSMNVTGNLALGTVSGSNATGYMSQGGNLTANKLVVGEAGTATFNLGTEGADPLYGINLTNGIEIGQYGTVNMYNHPRGTDITNNGVLNIYYHLTTNNLTGTNSSAMVNGVGNGVTFWQTRDTTYAGGVSTSTFLLDGSQSQKLTIQGAVSATTITINAGKKLELQNLVTGGATIQGGGSLILSGGGTMSLSGANSHQGMTVTGGTTVNVSSQTGLGASGITVNLANGKVVMSSSFGTLNYTLNSTGSDDYFDSKNGSYSVFPTLTGNGNLTLVGWSRFETGSGFTGNLTVGDESVDYNSYVRFGTSTVGSGSSGLIKNLTLRSNGTFGLNAGGGTLNIGLLHGTGLTNDGVAVFGNGANDSTLILGNGTSATDTATYTGVIRAYGTSSAASHFVIRKEGLSTQVLARAGGNISTTNGNPNIRSVTVNGGVLELRGSGLGISSGYWTSGTPITVNSGGTLRYSGHFNSNAYEAYTINGGKIELSATNYLSLLNFTNGGTLDVLTDLDNSYLRVGFTVAPVWNVNSGTVTVDNRTTMVRADGFETFTLNVASGATLNMGSVQDLTEQETYRGMTLEKTGAGLMTLSGTSTYIGATKITNGTLKIGNDDAVSTVSSGLIVNGGAFDLNGYSQTIGGVTGSGGSLMNSSSTEGTLTLNGTGTYVYSGATNNSNGSLSITKSGSGTQTLNDINANQYTQTAGTLNTSGTMNVTTSSVTGGTIAADSGLTVQGSSFSLSNAAMTSNWVLLFNTANVTLGAGSTVTARELNIGGAGSTGAMVMNISGATIDLANAINVNQSGTDSATVNMSSGTLTSAQWFTITNDWGGTAAFNLTGTGSVTAMRAMIGDRGVGVYTQDGANTSATFTSFTGVGCYSSGSGTGQGTLNMRAGTLTTPLLTYGNHEDLAAGQGYINHTGGTITATELALGGSAQLLAGKSYLYELNGANALLQADSITNASTLLHLSAGTLETRNVSGSLTGSGADLIFLGGNGTVTGAVSGGITLNGGSATFSGATTIGDAFVSDTSSAVTVNAAVSVIADAVVTLNNLSGTSSSAVFTQQANSTNALTLNNTDTTTYAGSISAVGNTVNKTGTGSLSASGMTANALRTSGGDLTLGSATVNSVQLNAGTNSLTVNNDLTTGTVTVNAGTMSVRDDLEANSVTLNAGSMTVGGSMTAADVTLNAGNLTAHSGSSITNSLYLEDATTLNFQGGQIQGAVSGSGTLNLSGTTTLSGASATFAGPLNVLSGTTTVSSSFGYAAATVGVEDGTSATLNIGSGGRVGNTTVENGKVQLAEGGTIAGDITVNDTTHRSEIAGTVTGGVTLTKSGAQILMSNGTIGSDVVTARGTVFHVTTGTINGDIQIGQMPSEDVDPLEVEPQIASSDSFLKQQTTGSVVLPRRGTVLSLGTMSVDDGGAAVLDLTGADDVVINGDVTLAPDSILRVTLDVGQSLTPTVINGTTTWGQSALEVVLNGKLVADETFLLFETSELQGTTEDVTKVTFRNAGGGVFFETSNVGDYIKVENDGGMVQVYVNIDSASIPEPGTWVLLSLGLLGLAWMRRSRKRG